jgi:hypothetical protein
MKKTNHQSINDPFEPTQEQYTIARKMLSRRFPIGSVCRITQLSIAELEILKHEVDRSTIVQEAISQFSAKTRSNAREIHLLATKKIVEQQVEQQAPWLFEDDWYLGYRAHQQQIDRASLMPG